MTTSPGEIYLVDLGITSKARPMLIVSRKDPDAPRALSICAPITTTSRSSDYEVEIAKQRFLDKFSFVNVQGLQAVQHHEPGRRLGTLPSDRMDAVKSALRFALDLKT